MKYIKTTINDFLQTLNESLSDTLYHYTSIHNAISIVKSNKINLSSGIMGRADDFGVKPFFLSCARTKTIDVGYQARRDDKLRFVLDGKKLSNKYKGKPVDYWGSKSTIPNSIGLNFDTSTAMSKFEFEDRIYSDKPYIENFNKYLIKIEILTTEENIKDRLKIYSELIRITEKENIKLDIYLNKHDLYKNINSITDKIDKTVPFDNNYKPTDYVNRFSTMIALILYDDKYLTDNGYQLFEEDLKTYIDKNKLEDLKLSTFEIRGRMRSLSYGTDTLEGLSADLHNVYKSGQDSWYRKYIHLLTKDFKKYKVNNIIELYNVKVKGLNPKSKQNEDYSKRIFFAYNQPDYENGLPYTKISNDSPIEELSSICYISSTRYVPKDAYEKYWNMRDDKDATIGDFINYLFKKYTEYRAEEILNLTLNNPEQVKLIINRK